MYYQPINQPFTKRVSRLDQPVVPNSQNSQFYQPLRKSLLRTNLSQSNISSRSFLSTSRVNNDLSTSRVSRRMESLSPDQAEKIVKNIYVPLNKRLLPTNNVGLVRNKRFQAIEVQQKVHQPIPSIKFNPTIKFNQDRVQEIVYQTQQQIFSKFRSQVSPKVTIGNLTTNISPRSSNNIYTQRVNFTTSTVTINPPKTYTTQQAYRMGMDARPVSTIKFNSIPPPPTNPPINRKLEYNTNVSSINKDMLSTGNFNNVTTSQESNIRVLPYNSIPVNVKQAPNSNMLTTFSPPLSNFGSRTSFEFQNERLTNATNIANGGVKQYDFSKHSSEIQSSTDYQSRKREDFKYNIFSIFDQPVNTKCQNLGCLKNQIIASKPKVFEWNQ